MAQNLNELISDCKWQIPNRTCENCPTEQKIECENYLQDLEEQEKAYMKDRCENANKINVLSEDK